MKSLILGLAVCMAFPAFSAETLSQETKEKTHDTERSMNKAGHRAEEAVVCAKGDLACAKAKSKHRAGEAKDYMKDKANEAETK